MTSGVCALTGAGRPTARAIRLHPISAQLFKVRSIPPPPIRARPTDAAGARPTLRAAHERSTRLRRALTDPPALRIHRTARVERWPSALVESVKRPLEQTSGQQLRPSALGAVVRHS